MFLFLTALSDSDCALHVDVAVFQTNFVPCQRIHFLRCSYFEPASMLVRCDPRHPKCMSYGHSPQRCCAEGCRRRGGSYQDERVAIDYGEMSGISLTVWTCPHSAGQFLDWSPSGF